MRTYLLRRALLSVLLSSFLVSPVLAAGCSTAPAGLQQLLGQGGWGVPSSYVVSLHDLNGDGSQEALVLLTDTDWCGSGGCTLLVAQQRGLAWHLISKITLVRPPVIALERKRFGWQSLSVIVGGGGVATHPVSLDFQQGRYPSNPTALPVSPSSSPSYGEALIQGLHCQSGAARPNISSKRTR
jgi:putative lipoprotein